MEDKIISLLENKKDALSLIEINDLLELNTALELKELENNLNKLSKKHLIFKTKKINIFYIKI